MSLAVEKRVLQGIVAQRYLLYALMGDLELKVNGL